MIKKYKEVLNYDLIEDVFKYFDFIFDKNAWTSSYQWPKDLIENSSGILVHEILDKNLSEKIKKCVEDKIQIEFEKNNLKFRCFFQVWGRNSYLNWHDDHHYAYNGTIYLNEDWNIDDGGLFLYMEDDQIYGICPDYNFMVINFSDGLKLSTPHCVTYISPTAKQKRITIQWRTNDVSNENKKINYF